MYGPSYRDVWALIEILHEWVVERGTFCKKRGKRRGTRRQEGVEKWRELSDDHHRGIRTPSHHVQADNEERRHCGADFRFAAESGATSGGAPAGRGAASLRTATAERSPAETPLKTTR